MATSGSYNFASSRDLVIENAYRLAGALGENETLSSTQKTIGAQFLNPMVKKFATFGMPVWATEILSINMSEWGANEYVTVSTLTAGVDYKPLKILGAWRRDNTDATNPSDTPIIIYTKDEYENLPNKLETGVPTGVYMDVRRASAQVYLWLVPDTYWEGVGILRLRVQRDIQDFDAAGDEPDFPLEWAEALAYQLAVRLAPQYGLAPADRAALERTAQGLLDQNLAYDSEDGSVFLQPAKR